MMPKFLSGMEDQCLMLALPVLSLGTSLSTSRPSHCHLLLFLLSSPKMFSPLQASLRHQGKLDGEESSDPQLIISCSQGCFALKHGHRSVNVTRIGSAKVILWIRKSGN